MKNMKCYQLNQLVLETRPRDLETALCLEIKNFITMWEKDYKTIYIKAYKITSMQTHIDTIKN